MKKKHKKISFIWWFLEPTYSHWLWGANLSKPGSTTDRGTNQQVTPRGTRLAMPEDPQKRGKSLVSVAVLALLRQYFEPDLVPLYYFPLVPINTLWDLQRRRYLENMIV